MLQTSMLLDMMVSGDGQVGERFWVRVGTFMCFFVCCWRLIYVSRFFGLKMYMSVLISSLHQFIVDFYLGCGNKISRENCNDSFLTDI